MTSPWNCCFSSSTRMNWVCVMASSRVDESLGSWLASNKARTFVRISDLYYYDRSCYCQDMKTKKMKAAPKSRIAGTKGETSRAAILQTAARLATTKGLNGLSIGDLADEVGMSKSGLYAHFKSKEELELATIEMA